MGNCDRSASVHVRTALGDEAFDEASSRGLAPTLGVSALLFLFNVIETKFLRVSWTSEFSHIQGHKRTPPRNDGFWRKAATRLGKPELQSPAGFRSPAT